MGQNTFLEVSSTYFHMHWPSTWADEFNALPANQQHPSTFNITTGIYIDGPEPTGQRFRDAYRHQTNIGLTRYIDGFLGASHQLKTGFENWWTPTGHRRVQIFRRHAPPLQRAGDGAVQRDGQDRLRSVGGLPLQHAADAADEDAELRRLRPGPRQLRARHAEPRPALVVLRRQIPARADGGGGGAWFPADHYPEINPGYSWNTFAPRTGVVFKLTEDGKNVAKASYSRYYESMYTGEFGNINPNSIRPTGVATYAWLGDLERQRQGRSANELGALKSQFVPRANSDRSEPEGSEERRDHVRVPARADEQRVVQRRLDPALVQRRHDRSELLRAAVQPAARPCTRRPVVTDSGPGQPPQHRPTIAR